MKPICIHICLLAIALMIPTIVDTKKLEKVGEPSLHSIVAQMLMPEKEFAEATTLNRIHASCDGRIAVYLIKIVNLEKTQGFHPEDQVTFNRIKDNYASKCIEYFEYILGSNLLKEHNFAAGDETEMFRSIGKWINLLQAYIESKAEKTTDPYEYVYPILSNQRAPIKDAKKKKTFNVFSDKKEPNDVRELLDLEENEKLAKIIKKESKKSPSQTQALKEGKGLCSIIDNSKLKYLFYSTTAFFKYLKTNHIVKQIYEDHRNENEVTLYSFILLYKVCINLQPERIYWL